MAVDFTTFPSSNVVKAAVKICLLGVAEETDAWIALGGGGGCANWTKHIDLAKCYK